MQNNQLGSIAPSDLCYSKNIFVTAASHFKMFTMYNTFFSKLTFKLFCTLFVCYITSNWEPGIKTPRITGWATLSNEPLSIQIVTWHTYEHETETKFFFVGVRNCIPLLYIISDKDFHSCKTKNIMASKRQYMITPNDCPVLWSAKKCLS